MMKQIAGRAGRRSSQWPNGLATCRNASDVAKLQEALAVRAGTAAVLLPCLDLQLVPAVASGLAL
jgi:hypothetical protein